MQSLKKLFAGQLPQLVLFDLDGTLIDSVPDIATATDTLLKSLGASPVGEQKVRGWVGNGAARLVQRALDDAGLSTDIGTAMTLWRAAYQLCCTRDTRLYPGARELLAGLEQAGIAMALTTNKPIQFARPILEHLGIARHFSLSLGGECVTNKKPASDMLQAALTETGARAELSLMVGDSAADINAARALGMPVAAVTYGYDQGQPVASLQPDLLLDDLRRLLD